MIPIVKQRKNPNAKTIVAVMGSQMSKTESSINIIGCELDDDPAPCLYIAPTKSFCEKVYEPRLRSLLNDTPSLKVKKKVGKQESKTQKEVAGVKVRLAWSGSATEISGDPARIVFVDEYDRCEDDVGGEGDVKDLADARHFTYADGQTWVFSTPTEGQAETEEDPVSGLVFWKQAEDSELVKSKTWKLMLSGTRHHWATPCPHCKTFFIPRFANLTWPENATPEEAKDEATLACTNCGALIDQSYKSWMHDRGVMVAPGQKITKTGKVLGLVKETDIISFWISGLMSPWVSWGQRAAAFLRAWNSGDPEKIQAVVNTNFGELYSVASERVDEDTLNSLKQPYKKEDVPAMCGHLVAGADVQKEYIYWTVKAFGPDMVSAVIDYGMLIGDTSKNDIFDDLAKLKDRHYAGLPVERLFVDSGYRTSYVYEFCRRPGVKDWAIPTKGRDTIEASPLVMTKLDVGRRSGRRLAAGLNIYNVNTDYFKKWIIDRFERDPALPGSFMLPEDVEKDYVKALRSEVRVVKPNGRPTWIVLDKSNHYFDCEVLALACAYSLNLQMVTGDEVQRERHRQREREKRAREANKQATGVPSNPRGDPFRNASVTSGGQFQSNKTGGWFGKR